MTESGEHMISEELSGAKSKAGARQDLDIVHPNAILEPCQHSQCHNYLMKLGCRGVYFVVLNPVYKGTVFMSLIVFLVLFIH